MNNFRWALVGLLIAAFVFGLADIVVITTSNHADNPLLLTILSLDVAWSFVITGHFVWWRRAESRVGPMMTAVGFAFLLFPLQWSNIPAVFMVGFLANSLAIVMLAHLLLMFPRGCLETRWEKGLIASAYLVGVGIQFVAALTLRVTDRPGLCEGCPVNPIALTDNVDLFKGVQQVHSALGALVVAAFAWTLWRNWRKLNEVQRASTTPVLVVGGLTLSILGVELALSIAGVSNDDLQPIYLTAIFVFALVPYAFLFGMLRSRFSRAGAVSELIANLNYGVSRNIGIRDAVATALGDDSLEFAYWIPEQERYIDADGREVQLPAAGSGRSWLPVERDGGLIAAIIYDSALDEHEQLVRATGDAAALALENARLEAELRARVEELRASRARIVETADTERQRLERDLHDGAQQHLVALALQLRMARAKLDSDPAEAAKLLDEATGELNEATGELRELARGIHPAVLTDRGLDAALKALAGRAPLPVEIAAVPDERLPAPVESAAYFVVAEALTNVARYAQATHAEVSVARDDGLALVEVRDDGVGGADPSAGTGLRGLADRVAALDGRLRIESPAGDGTIIRAELPCA